MKKTMTRLIMLLGMLLLLSSQAMALDVDFTVSADLPKAKGVSISASDISDNWGSVQDLDFGTLYYDGDNGIWRSNHLFAIDVGATGGAGSPDVDVSYGSETMPSGQTEGLGVKATASFTLVTGGPDPSDQDEADLTAHGPVKLLEELKTTEPFDETDLDGGFLRIRVGLYDGANTALNNKGGKPFTNSDVPGPYSGIITVSATID